MTDPAARPIARAWRRCQPRPSPLDDKRRHSGGGLSQAPLDLPPGQRTLQLLLADGQHMSVDPPIVSERITMTVE